MFATRAWHFNDEPQSTMSKTPTESAPSELTRSDVQDILDAAQVEVGRRYADTPDLCEILQSHLRQGVEDCNLREIDPMQLLHGQMRGEWYFLDAYNKHRLGKAAHRYYQNFPEAENGYPYNEEDNIPEELEWFPLRTEVEKRGFHVVAPPIYQVPGTVQHNQEFTARRTTTVKTTSKVKPSPKKTADVTPSSTKNKTGRAAANYDKLADAPSAQLDFPDGNITLAEMTTFLPQSIKSWDVIDRALFNGAMSVTLAGMINNFRDMPNGPIENNSVYRMMKGAMDKRALKDAAYKGWSVFAHQKLSKPNGFDPASVSVTGFRTPINYNKREAAATAQGPAPTILFRDLKNGVRIMPSGHDALDLTRCVQYCVDHPGENWFYPQDFAELVAQLPQDSHLIGHPLGPAPVQLGHQDASIVGRYTSAQKLNGAIHTFNRQRDCHGRLLKMPKTESDEEGDAVDTASEDDSTSETVFEAFVKKGIKRKPRTSVNDSDEEHTSFTSRPGKRSKLSPKAPSRGKTFRTKAPLSRLRKEVGAINVDSDSDSDMYQGPKKKTKKISTPPRTSGRTKRFLGSYNIDASMKVEKEEENVAPKKHNVPIVALRLTRQSINLDEEMDDNDISEDEED